ncbi:hypothetical protein HUE46_12660 [Flavobacterium columnare]|uniref:hypothetical protein n=1 Tax=Flavobacterium columnare TaxID=996 RepID=UPI0002D52EDC|nr:hypothetical protein [Flavobacterium columnare]ANO48955.1 hypothetical protein Pf1_00707 [Flavobacterium columnare]MEB3800380.1 hypothetical protein [Flavobacterium columnare]QOG56597.1 hypothetical protein HUE29_04025 [Flavobacterium columnare]QOG59322.1 hypothetical protein HUE30_04030 [Flavobacterium columnare]QOG62042.1 hypothetical protein HUE31_04030 [Flavobacterium columnare]
MSRKNEENIQKFNNKLKKNKEKKESKKIKRKYKLKEIINSFSKKTESNII